MFDLHNWSNPETLGLNITNAALGLIVVFALALMVWKALHGGLHGPMPKNHGKH